MFSCFVNLYSQDQLQEVASAKQHSSTLLPSLSRELDSVAVNEVQIAVSLA